MTVRLLFFAWVREQIGTGEQSFEIDAPLPLSELIAQLRTQSTGHAQALADPARLRAAINQQFSGWDSIVNPEDEVAIFPPVTGG